MSRRNISLYKLSMIHILFNLFRLFWVEICLSKSFFFMESLLPTVLLKGRGILTALR